MLKFAELETNPKMPTPIFGSEDKTRHKTTKTDTTEERNQVYAHPPPTFVEKEYISF
jgi:hypothetical protein